MLKETLMTRQGQYKAKIGELAYEKLRLLKRVDEIDKHIAKIEGAQAENDQALSDVSTQETIDTAKGQK